MSKGGYSESDIRSILRDYGPKNPGKSVELRPRLQEALEQKSLPDDLKAEIKAALSSRREPGFPGQTAGGM